MSVVSELSPRDRQLAQFFRREGFLRPLLTVAALRKADIKPQTAAALLSKETGNGRNVFGSDWGRQTGPPWSGHNVTEARYRALRKLRKPNGVGPCQLTSFEFCDVADSKGGCWRPFPNMLTGFELIARLIRAHGVEDGAARYNGGDSVKGEQNGRDYGRDFLARRKAFAVKLRRAGFDV